MRQDDLVREWATIEIEPGFAAPPGVVEGVNEHADRLVRSVAAATRPNTLGRYAYLVVVRRELNWQPTTLPPERSVGLFTLQTDWGTRKGQ